MDRKTKDAIVSQIERIVVGIIETSEVRASEFEGSRKIVRTGGVHFELASEHFDEYKQLCRQLLQEEKWEQKFSEKYVDNALQGLIARILKEGRTNNIKYYFEELLDEFNNYSQEHAVYIPLDCIQMYEVDMLEIGRVFLKRMSSSRISKLTTKLESLVQRTRNTPEEKALFLQEDYLDIESLREKICAEFHIVAEPERAREVAENEIRRVLDLLRYSIPALYPANRNISIGLQGEVGHGIRTGIIFSTDSSSLKFDSRRVGSIGNFDLSQKHIEIMKNIGVFELSKTLKKPIEDLTDFEETILRGIHWFSNSQTQSENENKFLNLMTCLETFLKPNSRVNSITNSIAEGVAIILEEDIEKRVHLKKRIKELYKVRSAISHGGRKAILDIDIADLTSIAWILTRQMIEWRYKFDSRDSLLNWIVEADFGYPTKNQLLDLFGFLPQRVDPMLFQHQLRSEWDG